MRTISTAFRFLPISLGMAAMLSATHGIAQAPGLDGSQVFLQRPHLGLTVSGCPVFLSANQRAFPQQVETGSPIPVRPAQGLTVTMTGLRALRIKSAEVVAHALSPRNRAVLTANSDVPDVIRPFHLEAKDGGGFSSDLWMDGVTSIRWIEVKSITYSNGTVWHESETQKCSVRPNPFFLILSTR
ncbi:hypothetical protein [Granulicella aggregans]|uniref:hypothetical protein n=1 Tax=Granulicella aggregans TaxID=474949 RepID=UPI0021E005F6|nr:hypothetical protein [Granulicella aggregans]